MATKRYVVFTKNNSMGVAEGAPAAVKMLEQRTDNAKFSLSSRAKVRSFLEEEDAAFADRGNYFTVYSHGDERFLGSIYQVQE